MDILCHCWRFLVSKLLNLEKYNLEKTFECEEIHSIDWSGRMHVGQTCSTRQCSRCLVGTKGRGNVSDDPRNPQNVWGMQVVLKCITPCCQLDVSSQESTYKQSIWTSAACCRSHFPGDMFKLVSSYYFLSALHDPALHIRVLISNLNLLTNVWWKQLKWRPSQSQLNHWLTLVVPRIRIPPS